MQFKDKKVNINKLINYGFKKSKTEYVFDKFICDNIFLLTITINNQGEIKTRLIENETQDEYVLHLTDATGSFVGKIRYEYNELLTDIQIKCFEKNIFNEKQTIDIINYINKKHGDQLEYLWEKFSNNAIWRRKDNKKWYGLLVKTLLNKLGINSDKTVEILNIRVNSACLNDLVDNINIFPAYHMNKKHWISIWLNGRLTNNTIFDLIEQSYILANTKKSH